MILSAPLPWKDDDWKDILRTAIRDVSTLRDALNLTVEETDWIDASEFELLVPDPYLSRIEPENPNDPLLLQIAPSSREEDHVAGYAEDPLGETDSVVAPGTLRKYQRRVLHIATSACPIHCRYCFRRNFPYRNHQVESMNSLLDCVRSDKSTYEVILSGGDPLTLSDKHLAKLIEEIGSVSHVKVLRLHTRFTVAIPQRVNRPLLDCLQNAKQKIVLVTHINHPNEIDNLVELATNALRQANVSLLNQSVLLRNINDSAHVLIQLSQRLFEIGVVPYYLHLLDRVVGAAHFDLPENSAHRIYREMQSQLPGYLVPKMVREIPGRSAKSIVVPEA